MLEKTTARTLSTNRERLEPTARNNCLQPIPPRVTDVSYVFSPGVTVTRIRWAGVSAVDAPTLTQDGEESLTDVLGYVGKDIQDNVGNVCVGRMNGIRHLLSATFGTTGGFFLGAVVFKTRTTVFMTALTVHGFFTKSCVIPFQPQCPH